jgi:hypothetical protein
VFKMKEKQVYLLVYVDDILIIGKDDKEITEAETILSKMYGVKDMGIAQYFFWRRCAQGPGRGHKLESTILYHTYV